MKATLTPARVLNCLQKHAERIKNDDEHRVETMSPGDAWAQGDLLLLCLDKVPDGAVPLGDPSEQLAPGDTQGSRHCLAALERITIYRLAGATPLDGPVIDAPDGCRVNHPEHGDVTLPPGVYGIVYQRAYAEELRRVLD